jgi:hypothetical protein
MLTEVGKGAAVVQRGRKIMLDRVRRLTRHGGVRHKPFSKEEGWNFNGSGKLGYGANPFPERKPARIYSSVLTNSTVAASQLYRQVKRDIHQQSSSDQDCVKISWKAIMRHAVFGGPSNYCTSSTL